MAEYIERAAAMEIVKRTSGDYAAAWAEIRNLPEADVAPVRRGRWMRTEDDWYSLTTITCSECHGEWCFEAVEDEELLNYRYCPNCGAQMGGGLGDA